MKDINSVCLSGRLTRDPELRCTAGGTNILSIGLAFSTSRKGASGEWEEVPNFVDCKVIGNRAEGLSRSLSKGKKVSIQGRLSYQAWEKDGQKKSKLEVIVDEISFEAAKSTTPPPPESAQQYDVYDEDIPF